MIREGSLPIPDSQIIIHGFVYDLTRKLFVRVSPSLVYLSVNLSEPRGFPSTSYVIKFAQGSNGVIIAVDAWVVPGWREIQDVTWPLRGKDVSQMMMADTGNALPKELLDLASMRGLIVAKIPPPLPGVTPEQLASNDGSDIPYPQPARRLAQLPPLRSPVWVAYGRNVYDVTCEYYLTPLKSAVEVTLTNDTALWLYGNDDLRNTIDYYKGQAIPTGVLSALLEREHSHRIIGELVQRKRLAEEPVGNEPDDLPSKLQNVGL